MSRHLDNLERLCNKLRHRYGERDALCQEFSAELEARRTTEPEVDLQQDWSVSYRNLINHQGGEIRHQVNH